MPKHSQQQPRRPKKCQSKALCNYWTLWILQKLTKSQWTDKTSRSESLVARRAGVQVYKEREVVCLMSIIYSLGHSAPGHHSQWLRVYCHSPSA